MSEVNPFTKEMLEWIFEKANEEDNKVLRRESSTLDFKENFNFNSIVEYGKFGASFANRKGGYLVFGIKDKPHLLLGMQNDQFLNLNIEKATTLFNEHFAPSLKWDSYVHEIDGKKYGLLYFFEESNKPIICTKNNNHGKFSEGDIYYRYSGQSRKIRHYELNEIIQNKIKQEKEEWLNFLKNAMQFKPDSALILDLQSGTLDAKNHSILIDENIVDKLKFIKEGEFTEKEGAPTLKLIGNITDTVQTHGAKIIERRVPEPIAITTEQLIEAFLNQSCEKPTEYLKQFCYESAYHLPIWYFILCSRMSIDEMETFWSTLNDVKNATRKKLLDRLNDDNIDTYKVGTLIDIEDEVKISDVQTFDNFVKETRLKLGLSNSRDTTIERSLFYKIIMENKEKSILEEIIEPKARPLSEAISHIPEEVIIEKKEWILEILSIIHAIPSKNFVYGFRRSLCSVDIKLSKSQVE